MRVAIGADHAGFALKQLIGGDLRDLGHEVIDLGTDSMDPVDYPDYAEAVGKVILDGKADRGVLVCGSGVGASVAANKLPGIRAALCHDTYSARQGVEHDDMNILVLGGRMIGSELARELVHAYLAALFTKEERHRRKERIYWFFSAFGSVVAAGAAGYAAYLAIAALDSSRIAVRVAQETAIRHCADRQSVSKRDQSAQLHLSLARV